MVAFVAVALVGIFVGGYFAGKKLHPANSALSAVKAELHNLEVDAEKLPSEAKAALLSAVYRVKSLL